MLVDVQVFLTGFIIMTSSFSVQKIFKFNFVEQKKTRVEWGKRGMARSSTFCLSSLYSMLNLSTEMFRGSFSACQG